MLLGKRRWAIRAMEEAGIPIRSAAATQLVSMLIDGAKQTEHLDRRVVGARMEDIDLVLISGMHIYKNQSAIGRLVRELGCDETSAIAILRRVHGACRRILLAQGRLPAQWQADTIGDP